MNYEIEGEPLPVVICTLERDESMICESGAMSWMTSNVQMSTTTHGGVFKMISRRMSNEKVFVNQYTARGGRGLIAFASSFPGSIRAFDIRPNQGIIAQKTAFLASDANVNLSLYFQKRLGAGFFGGEGFVMQKVSGNGIAFLEFDGYIKEYDLENGQQIVIDTGYLAAMSESCTIDIRSVPGVKNMLFGGEGVFNTVVTGPGRVWLQSMPASKLAGTLSPFLYTVKSNNS